VSKAIGEEIGVDIPAQVDELIAAGKGERFDPGHGRLMKEWIAMSAGEREWVALAKEAYGFVKGR
jgi:hypothetical protein